MKVTDRLYKANENLFSFEIIPPKRGKNAREILEIVERLVPFNPSFIDVTSHSAQAVYEELEDGTIRRRVSKKRPGTISICASIQYRYGIDAIPHLLCQGFTREETEDAAIELNFLEIENVMAIRGDDINYKKPTASDRTINLYANNLVDQLNDLRSGKYQENIANTDSIDFCIGVCGYPEKHLEAANSKTDIANLKRKVDAGANYIVTQMFFDNNDYFAFVKKCREAGITVPIIPGIKIIKTIHQLTSIPKNFNVSIPEPLVDEMQQNPKHSPEIGLNWSMEQCRELMNGNTKCIHFFILNDILNVTKLLKLL